MNKFLFYLRLVCGSFLILFSGVLTLPIYTSIKTSNGEILFASVFLCVVSLVGGHWWIRRAYDKKTK